MAGAAGEEGSREIRRLNLRVLDFCLTEGSDQAAMGFINALERAYAHIGEHPATGSRRYAFELDLSGLRSWPLARYPHLVFDVERSKKAPTRRGRDHETTSWDQTRQRPGIATGARLTTIRDDEW